MKSFKEYFNLNEQSYKVSLKNIRLNTNLLKIERDYFCNDKLFTHKILKSINGYDVIISESNSHSFINAFDGNIIVSQIVFYNEIINIKINEDEDTLKYIEVFKIGLSQTNPNYLNQRVGYELYKTLAEIKPIMNDRKNTDFSVGVWKKLIKENNFKTCIIDLKTGETYKCAESNLNKLWITNYKIANNKAEIISLSDIDKYHAENLRIIGWY